MKIQRRIITVLIVFVTTIMLVGCGSQQRFGQRKTPKGCNTCTKWG